MHMKGFESMGLMENNGYQNYKHWDQMMSYQPFGNADWPWHKMAYLYLYENFYNKVVYLLTVLSLRKPVQRILDYGSFSFLLRKCNLFLNKKIYYFSNFQENETL